MVHPFLIVEVPAYGLLDTLFELERGFPAQFFLELGRVDGVAFVVSGTVGYVGDEVHILPFGAAEQAVDGLDDDFDDVDVFPFVEATDIVGFGDLTLMENKVDGSGVILYIEPVAHILALAIDGQRLAMADVVDEERYQLLGELVRAVVVGTVGYDGRHPVGIVEGSHEVVARGFRSRIGTVWIILGIFIEEICTVGQMVLGRRGGSGKRRFDTLGMGHLQRTVDFVGRDVVETLALVFLGERFPIEFGRLKHAQRTHHIGAGKSEGVFDRSVDVTLGGQMDNAVDLVLLHQRQDGIEIANIGFDKHIVGFVFDVFQVGQVAGIGQLIEIYNVIIGILVDKKAHYMRANETGTAGNDDISFKGIHLLIVFKLVIHTLSESVQ